LCRTSSHQAVGRKVVRRSGDRFGRRGGNGSRDEEGRERDDGFGKHFKDARLFELIGFEA